MYERVCLYLITIFHLLTYIRKLCDEHATFPKSRVARPIYALARKLVWLHETTFPTKGASYYS